MGRRQTLDGRMMICQLAWCAWCCTKPRDNSCPIALDNKDATNSVFSLSFLLKFPICIQENLGAFLQWISILKNSAESVFSKNNVTVASLNSAKPLSHYIVENFSLDLDFAISLQDIWLSEVNQHFQLEWSNCTPIGSTYHTDRKSACQSKEVTARVQSRCAVHVEAHAGHHQCPSKHGEKGFSPPKAA